jgi:hypothetical protein
MGVAFKVVAVFRIVHSIKTLVVSRSGLGLIFFKLDPTTFIYTIHPEAIQSVISRMIAWSKDQ